ncbi:hypothetical protein AVEN_74121-1 [Araneus ventricosus]|uniref:Uncharacterized protein n=1 Tax=Araneus ventricosus TaxID=182803 RepID=A0A4Y2WJ58_ARAVE|nr:hypothetical protein AVEN_74121-1 [Araneus ventricosus]
MSCEHKRRYCNKNRSVGNSPTRRIMENGGLFANMQEKHVAQVQEQYLLYRLATQTDNNNSNSTFSSAQLTGFLARTTEETTKSLQSITTL